MSEQTTTGYVIWVQRGDTFIPFSGHEYPSKGEAAHFARDYQTRHNEGVCEIREVVTIRRETTVLRLDPQ